MPVDSARVEVLLDTAKDLRMDWGGQARDVTLILEATGRYDYREANRVTADVLAAVASLAHADGPEMRQLVGLR